MPRKIPYIDTDVAVENTLVELEKVLRVHNVTHFMKAFDKGYIKSVVFKHGGVPFLLPGHVDALYQMIAISKKSSPGSCYGRAYGVPKGVEAAWYAQAERCAWRNVMAWVKPQLALVEIGMVTVTEVFLPYMLVGSQETLYNRMLQDGFQNIKALGPGGKQ